MFDELVAQIEDTLSSKSHTVVGISGFGGAGKTTLANKLRDYFDIPDAQVVRLDNIFADDYGSKPIFEDYDWAVINRILKKAQSGERLAYQGRGFHGEQINIDEPLPKILIVEGVRLFKPEVMPYFDVSVWIDTSAEEATRRGEARDKADGADEVHVSRWRGEWLPKDQQYFESFNPEALATFLHRN